MCQWIDNASNWIQKDFHMHKFPIEYGKMVGDEPDSNEKHYTFFSSTRLMMHGSIFTRYMHAMALITHLSIKKQIGSLVVFTPCRQQLIKVDIDLELPSVLMIQTTIKSLSSWWTFDRKSWHTKNWKSFESLSMCFSLLYIQIHCAAISGFWTRHPQSTKG